MIAVIGGGPAGSIAAGCSARRDETVIYEPQGKEVRRVQCAGIMSASGLKRLGIDTSSSSSDDFIVNRVRGAKIYSPGGHLLELDGGPDKAFILDRKAFDNHLLERAQDAGAHLVNEAVDRGNIGELRKKAGRLILATGTNYNLHKLLGLERPKKFLYGAQYEMKIECDPDYVEMYYNVPGFFSWIIPVDNYARVGLCTYANARSHLDRMVKQLSGEGRVRDPKIIESQFGLIPLHEPGMKTQYDDIVLVGDAAGHVKATTGGGVILGGLAASLACEEDYEKRWKETVGKELRMHLLAYGFMNRIKEKNLDRFIRLLAERKEVVERTGDMDMASSLARGLLRDPGFMARFMLQLPGYVYDLL